MKKFKLFSFAIILELLFFSSCESVDQAQISADKFYEVLNNVDEQAMDNLLDKESVIDAGIKQDFYDVFAKHQKAFGNVTNYERYAFNTNTNNELTIVTLKFNCDTEKGQKVYEKLKFVKRGDDYKIVEYAYNVDKTVIDKEE